MVLECPFHSENSKNALCFFSPSSIPLPQLSLSRAELHVPKPRFPEFKAG